MFRKFTDSLLALGTDVSACDFSQPSTVFAFEPSCEWRKIKLDGLFQFTMEPKNSLTDFEKQLLDKQQACLFSSPGEMLWRSPAWSQKSNRTEAALLGTKWQEFVFEEDLPMAKAFIACGDESRGISFRAMVPETGRLVRAFWRKTRHRDGWIVTGTIRPLARHEMPPTMELEFREKPS
jgi:hypothetical protein